MALQKTAERLFVFLLLCFHAAESFVVAPQCEQRHCPPARTTSLALALTSDDNNCAAAALSRRVVLLQTVLMFPLVVNTNSIPPAAHAAEFAPGGTLVDYQVGVQVGNSEASPSRAADNSNVLFKQDHYFKFGTAAPFIPPGSTDFPKTMPFVLSQQRYDALKKYKTRIQQGIDLIQSLPTLQDKGDDGIPDSKAAADVYQLRAMGLLANGMLASENTGTTNELLLARYYINEIYLDLADMRRAASSSNKDAAATKKSWMAAKMALNSYLGMLNRVITPKVGDKFDLLSV